ncbi:uncharacterized protein clnk [Diretmus argenteus]
MSLSLLKKSYLRFLQERSKKSKKRRGRYNNVEEPEYHVVEDQEEVLNVHIQPARPLYADREYADRDLPRSSSAQSLCSNSSGNSSTAPRCPARDIPLPPAEKSSSKRQNHEWPQTKEDFDQHEFVPKEKPQQMYYEADWYVGTCSRAEADHALHLMNKDGAFLVRDCSRNTTSEPFVLAVFHERKVYNVKIRYIESTSKYSLGTGQRANDMFDSVAGIVKFHSIFPIVLINGRSVSTGQYPDNCVLTCPITKKDVDQLLG